MRDVTLWVPYCGAAPDPAGWLVRWNFDPVMLLIVGAGLVTCAGDRRQKPPRLAATVVFALLFISPLCSLGSALFTARIVHDIVLAALLAPLLVAATSLHRRSIPISLPLLTAIQALVFWAWHAPPLYAASMASDAMFWLMQITITGSAMVWWAKLRQASAGAGVVALLAAVVQMGLLGALITFAGRALYAPHYLTTGAWGLTPLEDQQIAGIIMWAPASAIYLLAALVILYRSLGSGRAAPDERAAGA